MNVVVLEDQQTDSSFIKRKLDQLGAKSVLCFRSGEALLHELRDGLFPDLFFLDVQIRANGIDGREVIEEIRAMPKFRDIPIALMSSNSSLLRNSIATYTFEKGTYSDLMNNVEKVVQDFLASKNRS